MQWTPCIVLEFSWFHSAWSNGTLSNAVDFMQHDGMQWILCSMAQSIPIECSGFHALWLNAVNSMQRGKWIPIECSGFHEAWLNALYSMKCEVMEPYWMQCILCSLIECSGFNGAWLNAVDFMQHGPKHPDWMQRIPWIVAQWIPIVCSGVHAAWWMHGFHAAW